MKKKRHYFFYLPFFLIIFLVLSAVSCPHPCSFQEQFVLAYTDTTNNVKIKYLRTSNLTASWVNGRSPTNFIPGDGVSLTINNTLKYTLFTDNSTGINMVWGLGDIWDTHGTAVPASPPISSPVGVNIPVSQGGSTNHNFWVIAFRQIGDLIFVGLYDQNTNRFLANFGPFGPLNTEVRGRPSMAKKGDKIYITWRRFNGSYDELVVTQGTIQQNLIILDTPQIIPTVEDSQFKVGIASEPVIAYAGKNMYLAVVREDHSTGGLHGWSTQLFQLSDKSTWRSWKRITNLDVHNQTYLALGGNRNGTLLIAAIRKLTTSENAASSAVLYHNGKWLNISGGQLSSMFDNNSSAYKPFTITCNY